jgi:hypothetical protein
MKYSMTQELYDHQYAHQDEYDGQAEYQVDYDPEILADIERMRTWL